MGRLCWNAVAAFLLCIPLWGAAQDAPPGVPLDAAQRAWLQAHPQLRVGVVLDAPYAQQDRRLQQLSGAHVELLDWKAYERAIDAGYSYAQKLLGRANAPRELP